MTEPPRPPGDYGPGGPPHDPYSPGAPPPTSGGGAYPPPTSGGGAYPPPTSGAGGYPPPTSGAGGYPQQGGYPPPGGYQQGGYPQGGYPQGGYPPGGYPPQGGPYGAPAGYATNDEKTWALIAHFGGIVVGFIAPLVAMLAKGNESPTVRAHAVEALNFQITWGIASIVAVIIAMCSFGILFFLPLITWLVVLIFSIMAGMKANEGVLYRYPMTIRMVK